jgi:S1-C subfamily serine protease
MRDGERIYITVTLLGREEEKAEPLANNIQNNENKPPNIGILIEEVSSIDYLSGKIKRKGVIVIDIEDDSQLFRKGLSKGDLIWKIGNIEITSISDFNNVLKKYKGQAVRFFVIRTVTDETFILSIRIPQ